MKFLNLGIIVLFIIALAIPSYAFVSDNIQMTKNIKYDKSSTIEPKPLGEPCVNLTGYIEYSVNKSITLCEDEYINVTIFINTTDNIVLNCNSSTLIGDTHDYPYAISVFNKSNITIINCKIKNYFPYGIWVANVKDFFINNNQLSKIGNSIFIVQSTEGVIKNNFISEVVSWSGIDLTDSNSILIENNTINNFTASTVVGISIFRSTENVIRNNKIYNFYDDSFGVDGIWFGFRANNNTINGNLIKNISTASSDGVGISVGDATNPLIYNNTLQDNDVGILFSYTSGGPSIVDGIVKNNLLVNNSRGIDFRISPPSIIFDIDFMNNSFCNNNISIVNEEYSSWGHLFEYNNFINGPFTPQVIDDGALNLWNLNYWSDYNGTDNDSDGIGDTPYIIDNDSQDNFPIINLNSNAPSCEPLQDTTPPFAPTLFKAILTGSNYEDVEISWYASSDEGLSGGTTKYEIWKSTEFSGVYSYVRQIPAIGSPTYTIIQNLEGDGTPSNYFYFIRAVDAANNTADSWYAGKFAQFLKQDWKFVSVPLEQWDTNLETVLQTLDFDQVRYYNASDIKDNWKGYWTFKSYKGDLKNIDHKMGFWVHVKNDDYLTTAGLVPVSTGIMLYEGWNMVGYPSFINKTIDEALQWIPWTNVEGFDPDLPPFHLKKLLPTDIMSAGNAYWIEVTGNNIWIVYNF